MTLSLIGIKFVHLLKIIFDYKQNQTMIQPFLHKQFLFSNLNVNRNKESTVKLYIAENLTIDIQV